MVIYSSKYRLDWLSHIFPVEKFQLTHERIIAAGVAGPELFVEPQMPTRAELERVHDAAYLDELEALAASGVGQDSAFEAPLTRDVLAAVKLAAGGTILACKMPLTPGGPGAAMNLSGGFHHAYADRGEGFCFINDVAVGVAAVLAEGMARRVMIVDGDVHQGNGTAHIFRDEERVFTLDIYQKHIYPNPKEKASLNIPLPNATGDEEYLRLLTAALQHHAEEFLPELIVYLAGGDPYANDQLGGLTLTKAGFARRDDILIDVAQDVGAGLAVVLAGGYPTNPYDLVDIHFQTAKALAERCRRIFPAP